MLYTWGLIIMEIGQREDFLQKCQLTGILLEEYVLEYEESGIPGAITRFLVFQGAFLVFLNARDHKF